MLWPLMDNFLSIAFTLFLVIDALGTLPAYLAQISDLKPKQAIFVAIRELLIALALMVSFLYVGLFVLDLLGVSKTTVELSGGVVLFLIALRLIFSHEEYGNRWKKGRPFIVPIATPLLAGPSFFAAITIFGKSETSNDLVILATIVAWALSALIYLFGRPIYNLVKDRGLLACQRLMGLLISLISVQMILQGIKDLISSGL